MSPSTRHKQKTRPGNGDKEGEITRYRAAPRPTRAPGSWGAFGLGLGQDNIFFHRHLITLITTVQSVAG